MSYNKYLKYKKKYLELINQFGGTKCPKCKKVNCQCNQMNDLFPASKPAVKPAIPAAKPVASAELAPPSGRFLDMPHLLANTSNFLNPHEERAIVASNPRTEPDVSSLLAKLPPPNLQISWQLHKEFDLDFTYKVSVVVNPRNTDEVLVISDEARERDIIAINLLSMERRPAFSRTVFKDCTSVAMTPDNKYMVVNDSSRKQFVVFNMETGVITTYTYPNIHPRIGSITNMFIVNTPANAADVPTMAAAAAEPESIYKIFITERQYNQQMMSSDGAHYGYVEPVGVNGLLVLIMNPNTVELTFSGRITTDTFTEAARVQTAGLDGLEGYKLQVAESQAKELQYIRTFNEMEAPHFRPHNFAILPAIDGRPRRCIMSNWNRLDVFDITDDGRLIFISTFSSTEITYVEYPPPPHNAKTYFIQITISLDGKNVFVFDEVTKQIKKFSIDENGRLTFEENYDEIYVFDMCMTPNFLCVINHDKKLQLFK